MKRSILISCLAALVLFACRKSDNPKIPTMVRVPTPLIKKDATTDQSISAQDPSKFKGRFVVDLYFKTDVKPQKFDIVIIKNGNTSVVKTFKADVTTFPTTLDITGADLATLFGSPVVVGDKFDIGADITSQDGQKFLAFPLVGNAYGAGVGNQVGASTSVRYEAVCKFDATQFNGDFTVLVDEWQDYTPGVTVKLTMVDATTISFLYAVESNAKPILIKVNPADNSVSVAKQVYGTYGTDAYSAESVAGSDSYVSPCEGIISVKLHHTTATGDAGNKVIKLKKK